MVRCSGSSRTAPPRRSGLAALAVLAVVGCGSVALPPTDPPTLEAVSPTVVRYGGTGLWAVVEYQFAILSLGDEWLFLDVAFTAPENRSATFRRDDVFVRTPAGRRLPLISQREFATAYRELRGRLVRANVVRDPALYFPSNRRPCRAGFFAVPGSGVTFDSVTVNDRRACYDRYFFRVPGGVQPGRWVLGIDLEESEVRIPFELEPGQR